LQAGAPAVPYERPAFAPDPPRDPDLLQAAADHAAQCGITRAEQDAYAVQSHLRAMQHAPELADEIVAVNGLCTDPYPRALTPAKVARLQVVASGNFRDGAPDCSVSNLAVSCRADGAAFVLLATPEACQALGLRPAFGWCASASVGGDPAMPLLAAAQAVRSALARAGLASVDALQAIELHDAFAVQGLDFCQTLAIEPARINRRGGGLARGHPIGASGAIALVRLLADLQRDGQAGGLGLAAIAGAGGIGAASIVQRLV
jgi:acetyl-CoA C-acetyltransferase